MSRGLRYDLLPTVTTAAGAEEEEGGEESDLSSCKGIEKAWQSERAKIVSMVVVIVVVLVSVSLGLRFIIAESARTNVSLSSSRQDCGSTRGEALSQGCAFDIVSFGWMAPACYDRELAAEFSSLRAWGWFLDENRTQAVSQREVELGEFDALYVSSEQLAYHCVFTWQKMHRALLRQAPLDSIVGGYNHTEFCARELVGEGGQQHSDRPDKATALMVSRFASCGEI
ncbi:uncharacterized protein Z519_05829 [Cladophialophora bantiana CBS 173.52]|uniref:Uncharacterized protein n=1 Tax=Cladophialophora bantiana (strain ATCC 10958 / CBS 173.52 / CDC B-1940 / NIH 8579) TaxID=1442370 RepID=A0A0D2I8V8_CLAB1|nr:uncharacterized protein Z519_05829 [Cladophialophora bantiana CBS 173.52]KIW93224.1 hypothetical protein Z519_05829 [Cladophialophora bantiana CBS 173.52]